MNYRLFPAELSVWELEGHHTQLIILNDPLTLGFGKKPVDKIFLRPAHEKTFLGVIPFGTVLLNDVLVKVTDEKNGFKLTLLEMPNLHAPWPKNLSTHETTEMIIDSDIDIGTPEAIIGVNYELHWVISQYNPIERTITWLLLVRRVKK